MMSEEEKEKKSEEKDDTINLKFNFDFLKNKKFQTVAVIVLMLITLLIGIHIRTADIPNLVNKVTGQYVPLALDPFYWLRIAQTIVTTNGHLPAVDPMRTWYLGIGWSHEITPRTVVLLYRVLHAFSPSVTVNYADIIFPVFAFVFGVIAFFFFIWFLTKKKWLAAISASVLALIPSYLYRSIAGFSDHDVLGMMALFISLMVFTLSMNYLEKKKSKVGSPVIVKSKKVNNILFYLP